METCTLNYDNGAHFALFWKLDCDWRLMAVCMCVCVLHAVLLVTLILAIIGHWAMYTCM